MDWGTGVRCVATLEFPLVFFSDYLLSLELKRRSADEQGASKQVVVNDRLRDAVVRVQKRKFGEVE